MYFRPRKRVVALTVFVLAIVIALLHTPRQEIRPVLATIPEGASLGEAAVVLKEAHLITSTTLLKTLVTVMGGGDDVKAGDYLFSKQQGTLRVAWRLIRGQYDITPVRVFIPEGSTVLQMSKILSEHLLNFDTESFIKKATPLEGYLFPDTYLLPPNAKHDQVVKWLSNHFAEKVGPLADEIRDSGHTLEEIITMASIIEEEVRTMEDRQLVSGILWKRISVDMPLQVDAPFAYLIGKASAELSMDDLEMDSPYNTYTHKGLPPGPITNPGLEAIEAALRPIESEYFFYLSDSNGTTHFAKNFDEHKANKSLYLR